MERHELTPLIEALLFVCDEPVTVNALVKALDDEAVDQAAVKAVLEALSEAYEAQPRGFQLARFGRGYQLVTRERYSPWVESLLSGRRKQRLSRAALETGAVIAYKQPITRLEIERVRGVDAGGVVNTLLERGLIMIKGRDPGPGRPLLYGTTQAFLDYFGLEKLGDLPRLEELVALAKAEQASMWDETELRRFEKHGVDADDVPPPPAEEAEEEAPDGRVDGESEEDVEADRAAFHEVAATLAERSLQAADDRSESGAEPDVELPPEDERGQTEDEPPLDHITR
jgi:segregation and condensation protein B